MRRVLVSVAAVVAAFASATASTGQPAAPPQLPASAWYLVGEDGAVLAAQSPRERRPVASITKLMTAVVTLEHARLSELVTVSPASAAIGGSTVELRAGDRITVAALLEAMLVPSANDAAHALATHVGRGSTSRFVELMNDEARELGLDETSFTNPHGLDEPGHESSAEDATLLFRHALGIPFLRDALDGVSVFVNGRTYPTTDDLLASWPPLVGGKTGHTAAAGWSEAAAAQARGARVYGTVLGSPTRQARNDALQQLLSYGLSRYRRIAAVDAHRVYAVAETQFGRGRLELVAPVTIARTVHDRSALVERVVAPDRVELPVTEGEPLGRVDVWERDRLIASSTLVAARAVSEPGTLRKSAWYAGRTVENLWGLVT